jgi:DNA primase
MYYGILWDMDNSRWILPIRSWGDNALMGWQEKGYRERYFKNRPTGIAKSKTLFNSYTTNYDDCMIVVESPLDAARLYSAGIDGGAATFGTSVSPEQLHIMRKTDNLIFAFDNDDAGKKAFQESLKIMSSSGLLYDKSLSFFNVDLGRHKDPDELLKSSGREDMEMHIEVSRKVKNKYDAAQWSANVSDLSID